VLNNICKSEFRIETCCNAEMANINVIKCFPSYSTVWYYSHGIADIANFLSLARMTKTGYQVSYNSKSRNSFTVSKTESGSHIFKASDCRLYYMNINASSNNILVINTVANNIINYTK
jgi:hypothetical protein